VTETAGAFELHPQLARDCVEVGDFPLSRLLLMNDRTYPWFLLVPRRQGLREIFELEDEDVVQLARESACLGRALLRHLAGDKLNVAALGNLVPQLHVHHIVRFRSDPAWPRPVWGVAPAEPYREPELDTLLAEVRELLRTDGLRLPAG
jgi:diadenosine tetraphosphate (Ap4A) HIT family hydrolase